MILNDYIVRTTVFDEHGQVSWTRIMIPLILFPIFFGLGILFYLKYPTALPITGRLATQYNSQPQNNLSNYNGQTLNSTSFSQGSLPQVGIGGGPPLLSPTVNYCPLIK